MNDKRKSIILAANKAQLRSVFALYDKLSSMGKQVLILTGDNVDTSGKRCRAKKFQDYKDFFPATYAGIKEEAYALFSSLAGQKVCENVSLRELTKYREVCLWDLSAQDIISELFPILYDVNMLETVLNFEQPAEVYVIDGVSNPERILGLICNSRKIPFFTYKRAGEKALVFSKLFWRWMIFAKRAKRLLINLRFLAANLMKSAGRKQRYKVIFFNSVARYLASILPVIFKYNDKERLVIDTFSSCSRELNRLQIPYMDFYGYKPYSLFNTGSRRWLRRVRAAIDKNSYFYEKPLYKQTALGPILKDLFEKLIYEVFPHNIQKVEIARKILLSHRPEVVVVIDASIDIALTAKSLSIPVVAIQSGFIIEFCCFGPIAADAVTVDGNYWKEFLLKKHNFVPDKILVSGPTKFDLISNNKSEIKDAEEIPGCADSKKKVVFATTYIDLPLGMLEYERQEQLNSVCRAIRGIKQAHLIIKLHPCEQDSGQYRQMAREMGLSYSIVRDVEMLELLKHCDLLITSTSTAGYEAILLDKNVVALFGSSRFEPEDHWNFKKYDAALVVDNLGELEGHIRNALFDPGTISRLKKGREEYIDEHAYRLDGNASARVKERIDSFLSKC